jgi:hypothetical protein
MEGFREDGAVRTIPEMPRLLRLSAIGDAMMAEATSSCRIVGKP